MGPAASVLLQDELDQGQRAQLNDVIDLIGERGTARHDFLVTTLQPLEHPYTFAPGRLVGVRHQTPDLEDDALALMDATFGLRPIHEVAFDAASNQPADHLILGAIVLHIASLVNGIIDFGGALVPPLPAPLSDPSWYFEVATWHDIAPYVQDMAATLPGTLLALPDQTTPTRTWVRPSPTSPGCGHGCSIPTFICLSEPGTA